jgi:hypothetical protein
MPRGNVKVTTPHPGVSLIDGVHRNFVNPATFSIPSYAEKFMVETGKFVKIGLEAEDMGGERFWVKVTRRQGDKFVGEVSNDLVHTAQHGIVHGDRLAFEVQHILGVMDR